MALTDNNSQFAGGKASNLNFAGTSFSADTSLAAPQLQGKGTLAANSSWVATIYSQKVLMAFRTASVVEAITNNDYYGEISKFGDSVIIIKEPDVGVKEFHRGMKLETQAIDSDSLNLVLDKANAFQFQVDDIEKKISHVNWQSLTTNKAAYRLRDAFDKEVLEFMVGATPVANIVTSKAGETAIATGVSTGAQAFVKIAAKGANALVLKAKPTPAQFDAGTHMDPLDLLNRFNLNLDLAEVPEEGRYVVVDPEFIEMAMRMDSNLLNRDYNGGKADLSNGLVTVNPIRGLKMYKTNNAPRLVTTARPQTDAKLQDTGRIIVAGHMSAVATVSAIVETETFRSQQTFADIVRGLHVYGRGVIRPESLTAAAVTYKPVLS